MVREKCKEAEQINNRQEDREIRKRKKTDMWLGKRRDRTVSC